MNLASGRRESATNRLGEHGGMGFGPMRHICKRSPKPPELWAVFCFCPLMPVSQRKDTRR
jgi:hypothetical protein